MTSDLRICTTACGCTGTMRPIYLRYCWFELGSLYNSCSHLLYNTITWPDVVQQIRPMESEHTHANTYAQCSSLVTTHFRHNDPKQRLTPNDLSFDKYSHATTKINEENIVIVRLHGAQSISLCVIVLYIHIIYKVIN